MTADSDAAAFSVELNAACEWLLQARPLRDDEPLARWGWLQDVPPNAQNTAEVLLALSESGRASDAIVDEASKYLIASLDDSDCNVRDRGWVARGLSPFVDGRAELQEALLRCRDWLVDEQNDDGGWGDRRGETSLVPTTALAVEALGDHRSDVTDRAVVWLAKAQHASGGWSLLAEGQDAQPVPSDGFGPSRAQEIRRSQTDPNAACTAFAMLALLASDAESRRVDDGARWLLSTRNARRPGVRTSGGWPVFRERGIRAGEWYTFRHFSTAWALLALTRSLGSEFVRSQDALQALDYLLLLQEEQVRARDAYIEGGGWRCSPDGEPYTWATVNAVEALSAMGRELDPISGRRRVEALLEDMRRRDLRVSYTRIGDRLFAFNLRSAVLAAVVVTLLSAAWVWAETRASDSPIFSYTLFVVALCIVAFPWSLVLAIRRSPESPAIGRAYLGAVSVVALIAGTAAAIVFAQSADSREQRPGTQPPALQQDGGAEKGSGRQVPPTQVTTEDQPGESSRPRRLKEPEGR